MPTATGPAERLIHALERYGPASAAELGADFGLSQPSISRLLASAGDRLVRIGRARRTRYAVVRNIRGLGTTWPVYRIDSRGQPEDFGQLTALYGAGTLVTGASADWLREEFADGLFPGVPWFLDDQRPQGFLGRQFAQRWSRELGLPEDVLLWDDDAVLAALLVHGEDGPGNFLLGSIALSRALQAAPTAIPVSVRAEQYGELASAAVAGDAVGSSAAGEQPKFTAAIADDDGGIRHVIVKFSEPAADNATARRWADLLICEHLAGEMLAGHGNPSARTELVWSQGRLCLEVTRFDRIGAYGRRGCVTLAAWSDAHDGNRDDWANAASRMRAERWIDDDALNLIRQRWWFGRLIGNTDMHFGNLCFFLDDALPLQVTPGYDMLPMLYRPAGNGAVIAREFRVAAPLPGDLPVWRQVAGWAEDYWQRVSVESAVSDGFRQVAEANRAALAIARDRFDPVGERT